MARARGKPTSPVKRPPRADERSSVQGTPPATARKRAAAKATPARKPAVPAAPAPTARIPRSTKRSALPDGVDLPARKRAASPTPPVFAAAKKRRPAGDGGYAGARTGPLAASALDDGGDPHTPASAIEPSGELRPSARGDREPEATSRVMELNWGDDTPSSRRSESLVQRWAKRGDALLRHLAEHGAARHEYRADLEDGRFVWVDPGGRVSAEAQAQVLCSWSRTTSALAMAWADPLVRRVGIGRVEGMPAERDDVDEETAWRIAMEAADGARADYLYRVTTPHAWYFLALANLTFRPERDSWSPGTPVALVLRGLAETRRAVESRAEPAHVVRDRIEDLGEALLVEAEYAYRATDWVARLSSTGRRLVGLGGELPRRSFDDEGDPDAPARSAREWLDRQETIDLSDALAELEDEWALFA